MRGFSASPAGKTAVFGTMLLLAALACGRAAAPAPTETPGMPAGQSTRTLSYDGLRRSYVLYVPASLDQSRPAPLVLVFHGGTGNGEGAARMSGFNRVADGHGFVVVYANGTGRLSDEKLLTWNAGTCCGYAQQANIDDVGFVRALVGELHSLMPIDPKRTYATGMSNGALLSQRLACEAADLFAAIGPVAGTLNFPQCHPSAPVSVIEFHGTADQHIPYEGGVGPESLVDVAFASVPASIAFWVSTDGCRPEPESNTFAGIRHDVWSGCAASTAVATAVATAAVATTVELYTIIGGGHAWPGGAPGWPGGDQPTQAISASALMWQFFAAHPRP